MSDVSISYKGAEIAALDDSGTKTLLTQGKYCEDDIEVAYTKPSGGGGDTLEIKGVYSVDLQWQTGLPVKFKIISKLLNNVALRPNSVDPQVQESATHIEEIEIAANEQTTGINVIGSFRYNGIYALKKINFNFIPIVNIYDLGFVYGANKNPYFEDFLGLNFALCGGGNYRIGNFENMGALKNVTCKPNTLGQLDMVASNRNWWRLPASSLLTDASLCQIANALCAMHTSTLTLHTTPKARCSTLMGTVSQVTDDTGTYDFFTQDESGTVTLADFITNTKGWTLA